MPEPDLKSLLESRACFGTFLKLPCPEVVHILALSGFDFIICDMEHGQITEAEARRIIREGVSVGLPVVVRLPEPTPGLVNRLLEAGACGVQMPRLRTAEDTMRLHSMMHYPPNGTRSVGTANLASKYGGINLKQYLESENRRVLTIGQFETRTIDDPADPMFQGLDIAFIGPVDLSVDFGLPGQFNQPEVQAHVRNVETMAATHGVIMGGFAGGVDQARKFYESGYRFIAVSGDISLLVNGAKSLMSELKALS